MSIEIEPKDYKIKVPYYYDGRKITIAELIGKSEFTSLDPVFAEKVLTMIREHPTIGIMKGGGGRSEAQTIRSFHANYTVMDKPLSYDDYSNDPRLYEEIRNGKYKWNPLDNKWYKRNANSQHKVAAPGSSYHGIGLAVDLTGDVNLAARLQKKYGLNQVDPKEDAPHFQQAGLPNSRAVYQRFKTKYGDLGVKQILSPEVVDFLNKNATGNAPELPKRVQERLDQFIERKADELNLPKATIKPSAPTTTTSTTTVPPTIVPPTTVPPTTVPPTTVPPTTTTTLPADQLMPKKGKLKPSLPNPVPTTSTTSTTTVPPTTTSTTEVQLRASQESVMPPSSTPKKTGSGSTTTTTPPTTSTQPVSPPTTLVPGGGAYGSGNAPTFDTGKKFAGGVNPEYKGTSGPLNDPSKPYYYSTEDWQLLLRMSKDNVIATQNLLAKAYPGFTPRVLGDRFDPQTVKYFKLALGRINQLQFEDGDPYGLRGKPTIDALSVLSKNPTAVTSTSGSSGTSVTYRKSASADLKSVFQQVAQQSLGRDIDEGTLNRMVEAFQNQEVTYQRQAARGGTVMESPTAQVFAQNKIQSDFGDEVDTRKLDNIFASIDAAMTSGRQ